MAVGQEGEKRLSQYNTTNNTVTRGGAFGIECIRFPLSIHSGHRVSN